MFEAEAKKQNQKRVLKEREADVPVSSSMTQAETVA